MTWIAILACLSIACSVLITCDQGLAQTRSGDDLKALHEEIGHLKEGQQTIIQRLEEMAILLQERQPGPRLSRDTLPEIPNSNITIDIKGYPSKGLKSARIVMVEFSDYQCPYCAKFFRETFLKLEEEFINSGKVRYVFRDFPIEELHPQAFKAAEAARCADDQGKFWLMHDQLFLTQNNLTQESFIAISQSLHLDQSAFDQCVQSAKHKSSIGQSIKDGRDAGVKGTPTLFIGIVDSKSAVVRVRRIIRGAQPYATIRSSIADVYLLP